MKKLTIFITIFAISMSMMIGLSGCGNGSVKVDVCTGYNAQKDQLINKMDFIPKGQNIFVLLRNDQPFGSDSINLSIYTESNGKINYISGYSTATKKLSLFVIFPINMPNPGDYHFKFTANQKVLADAVKTVK